MRSKTTLTADDAAAIIVAAKAEAMANNWNVSIAVVDDAGFLIHLERMEGAKLQTPDIAIGKARSAALFKNPTKMMEDTIKDRPAMLSFGFVAVQGGIPVIHNGECVGGIGVSGVKSNEDEIVAIAGRKAVVSA